MQKKMKKIDPSNTGKFQQKEDVLELMAKKNKRLGELLDLMFADGRYSFLIILHGIDASGKDGTVKSLFSGINPQAVRVQSFKRPSEEELKHDFLWRCHKVTPERGTTAIFNRSYYEEVTTVKVHPEFLDSQKLPLDIHNSKNIFEKRYEQINHFEKMLNDNGTIVLKFLLHISKEEQRSRLQARLDDPTKNWKFEASDLKERKWWNAYMKVFQEMVDETHTKYAPWMIVPANNKWYRNYVVLSEIVDALEKLEMKFPKVKSKVHF